ncbi:hypothetical protein QWY20_02935 [Alkalimonas sp. MEB108]|uniref:Uncharacterized protein n=1 Tax=Alkalimonas cellulosilytica TaxID=3058395 RepID=A0ABU7J1N6_9GAMM|nr:hypothetical protein [Alkalimonas sp. MEB108]MEE2000396.1 hypothetical protein [Alkalimonas sp. MEB108]
MEKINFDIQCEQQLQDKEHKIDLALAKLVSAGALSNDVLCLPDDGKCQPGRCICMVIQDEK